MDGIFVVYVFVLFCSISRQQDYGDADDLNTNTIQEGVFDYRNIEKFEYEDGIAFLLMIYRLNWEEAEVMCGARNGTLAVFKDKEKFDFIGQVLAQSDLLTQEDVWIGADYNSDTHTWSWLDETRSTIQSQFPPGETYPRESFPPWLEDPAKANDTGRCLAADRYNHDTPVLVAIPCHLRRSFLCEIHGVNEGGDNSDEDGGPEAKYHIFNRLLSWDAAYLACRDNGWDLAVLDSAQPLPLVADLMLRHRPVLNKAWIGARYVGEKEDWVWLNDEALNNNASRTPGYPPWYNDDAGETGCLALDRSLVEDPVFVAKPCASRRPFICQQGISKGNRADVNDESLYKVNGSNLLVSKRALTWLQAVRDCKSRKGRLLTFTDDSQDFSTLVAHLKETMISASPSDTEASLDNVWLGARLKGGKWRWIKNGKGKGDEEGFTKMATFPYGQGANEVIQFCQEAELNEQDGLDCLNLTRENHADLVLYGMMCNFTQRFICIVKSKV